jgi:hypothetical protein
LSYLQQASEQLPLAAGPAGELWQAQVRHYRPLIEQIIAQTERRVLAGESVPAGEKLVSLFEPHADIIVKGSRDVDYGHKLNLTSGRSGLILDLVIEAGNPADSDRLLPMLERHIAFYGAAPRQAAADGGYASRANLSRAKAWGVRDMAFHKKSGSLFVHEFRTPTHYSCNCPGIDVHLARRDFATRGPVVDALLDRNDEQAKGFGLRGTPAYIVGATLYRRGLDKQQLGEAVERARAA